MLHLRRSRGYLHSNLLLEWGEVNVGTISVVLAPITFVAEKVSMMPCFRTLLTMALAGALGSLWGCGKSAPEQAAKSPEELLQIVILNADEYRQEITDIDRLVFDEKPFDKDRRALLATKLGELAARVKAAKDSHFLEIEAYETTRLADGFKKICRNSRCAASFPINGCASAIIFSTTAVGSRAAPRISSRRRADRNEPAAFSHRQSRFSGWPFGQVPWGTSLYHFGVAQAAAGA